ncbi:MAG: GerMN domain-containing protein [Patescibacteria group bacterium]|nr:GerMN domain-containing protein [Patescibacteria group bacterium]
MSKLEKIILAIFLVAAISIVSIFFLCVREGSDNGKPPLVYQITKQEVKEENSKPGVGINIEYPTLGVDKVQPIFEVKGSASDSWFFEGSFPVTIEDASGKKVGGGVAQTQNDWTKETNLNFVAKLSFDKTPKSVNYWLVFNNDNPSGEKIRQFEFRYPLEIDSDYNQGIKLYWIAKPEMSFGDGQCDSVYESERFVKKSSEPIKQAIEELLTGPNEKDSQAGFTTSINKQVKILGISLNNGNLKIDFDKTIEQSVGGSCRVSAIRKQIEKTAKQFSAVKKVIIAVEGRVDDALQP